MDNIWEMAGAIAGVFSFIFAVYEYIKSKTNQVTEKAKILIYKQRLSDLHSQLVATMHSIDAIVQIGKQDNASVEMLQNVARVARGNMYVSIKKIEKEKELLKSWQYGKMVESQDVLENNNETESTKE